jgi:predicted dehydrogenase
MNQGIHTVDLLLWLFGDVSSVWARTSTALHEIEVEDTVVASLEFASGALGNLEAATSAYPGFSRRIEMTWSQGTIVIENDRIRSVSLRRSIDGFDVVTSGGVDERSSSPVVSDTRGHRALIEDFILAIASGGTPFCDGHDARRSVQLVNAIYESARSGLAVTCVKAFGNSALNQG